MPGSLTAHPENSAGDGVVKVDPLRIFLFNQCDLPSATPPLRLFLPFDGAHDIRPGFKIDQPLHAISFRETGYRSFPVFVNTTDEVVRHADVQRTGPLICQNVDIVAAHQRRARDIGVCFPACEGMAIATALSPSSCPRRRASIPDHARSSQGGMDTRFRGYDGKGRTAYTIPIPRLPTATLSRYSGAAPFNRRRSAPLSDIQPG